MFEVVKFIKTNSDKIKGKTFDRYTSSELDTLVEEGKLFKKVEVSEEVGDEGELLPDKLLGYTESADSDVLVVDAEGYKLDINGNRIEIGDLVTEDENTGAIIHAHDKKGWFKNENGEELYERENVFIGDHKMSDVYNTLKSLSIKDRKNARQVGCIDAGEFSLEELKRLSVGKIFDMILFPFHKVERYDVNWSELMQYKSEVTTSDKIELNGLIVKEVFKLFEGEDVNQERNILTYGEGNSITYRIPSCLVEELTNKSYDINLRCRKCNIISEGEDYTIEFTPDSSWMKLEEIENYYSNDTYKLAVFNGEKLISEMGEKEYIRI